MNSTYEPCESCGMSRNWHALSSLKVAHICAQTQRFGDANVKSDNVTLKWMYNNNHTVGGLLPHWVQWEDTARQNANQLKKVGDKKMLRP